MVGIDIGNGIGIGACISVSNDIVICVGNGFGICIFIVIDIGICICSDIGSSIDTENIIKVNVKI